MKFVDSESINILIVSDRLMCPFRGATTKIANDNRRKI